MERRQETHSRRLAGILPGALNLPAILRRRPQSTRSSDVKPTALIQLREDFNNEELADDRLRLTKAIADAEKHGWALTNLESVGQDENRLRQACAPPAPLTGVGRCHKKAKTILVPRSADRLSTTSLSAVHGEGAFPLHTDGAHIAQPDRWIVLYCAADEQNRPTLLQHWREIETLVSQRELLAREVFYFCNGRRSFADTISCPTREFVRFDQNCMAPATTRANRLLRDVDYLLQTQSPTEISWYVGNAIVIDNWRILHGRGRANSDGARILFRQTLSTGIPADHVGI